MKTINELKAEIEEAKRMYDHTRYGCELPTWLVWDVHKIIAWRIELLEEIIFKFEKDSHEE